MATQITHPADKLYEEDFYAWSRWQAELLRLQRFSDLDLRHLIEEVEDLGETVYRSVRSRVRAIIEHLLKLEHSPASEPKRGWRETIRTQRADLDEDLTAALRPRIEAGLPDFYAKARRDAAAAPATMASPPLPMPCHAPVPTRSIRSSANGCRKRCADQADTPASVSWSAGVEVRDLTACDRIGLTCHGSPRSWSWSVCWLPLRLPPAPTC